MNLAAKEAARHVIQSSIAGGESCPELTTREQPKLQHQDPNRLAQQFDCFENERRMVKVEKIVGIFAFGRAQAGH